MRKGTNEALSERVCDHDKDGRDRVCRAAELLNGRTALHSQHVGAQLDQVRSVAFGQFWIAARPTPIDVEVLAFDPAQRGETLGQEPTNRFPWGMLGGVAHT